VNAVTNLAGPLGNMVIESSAEGVLSVRFGPKGRTSGAGDAAARDVGSVAATELAAYLEGRLRRFSVPVDLSWATPFLKDIYSALMTVPYGCTTSYAALAVSAGRFDAARAVGGAMAKNRVLIIVPCHRVIAANGRLGGWSGPEGLKEKLHAVEGIGPLK
jgi:methylated-DNA-[protein]-cysteine S-methyltransferase